MAGRVKVESGKGCDALEQRSVLRAALAQARAKVSIAVAKLDRLSPGVHFFFGRLIAQRMPFIVAELGADTGTPRA